MKKNETVTVRIDRLDNDGAGLGTLDGHEVKVAGTVPGDVVRVFISRIKRTTAQGKLAGFESSEIERISPPCPHFSICGGCRWQDIPYPSQLAMKAGMLGRALERVEGFECPPDLAVTASPDLFQYRNKMEFSFDRPPGSGALLLGLHEAGWFNRVFDVTGCLLESPQSNRIIVAAREFFGARGTSAFGMKSHLGLLKYLVIREGKATGDVMVNLVTSGEEFACPEAFSDYLREVVPAITTITWSINRGVSGIAAGEERRVLAGEGYLQDRIGTCRFAISPESFFQTNTAQAGNLYATIAEFAGLTGTERVLDLYCGTGTIGIALAGMAGHVLGIELSEEAVRDARVNASLNQAGNIDFMAGKAEEIVREGMGEFDVLICDPPRVGIHPRAMDHLVRMRIPRMVYVSCNIAALPNDLAVLMMAGYRIRDIRAFDMSPHTPHIETAVLLERI